MDQIKTGRFIAEKRKEKGLTQRELADKLSISDKTVSKWERGAGLPEVSLMLPLCENIGISVNELLLGEHIEEKDYKKRTEEIIMDLIKEKQENKKKVILAVITCVITLIGGTTLILVSGYLTMENYLRIILTVIGLIVIFGGIGVAAALEWNAGTYECPNCHTRFIPTFGEYLKGAHTPTTRVLTCPHCGKKSWCKKRLTH